MISPRRLDRPALLARVSRTTQAAEHHRDSKQTIVFSGKYFFGGRAEHGLLRGWAITDAEGRYSFATIRPSGYPDSDLPAHVHTHVIEVGRCTYYIDDILFEDDPRLTKEKKAALILGRADGAPRRR